VGFCQPSSYRCRRCLAAASAVLASDALFSIMPIICGPILISSVSLPVAVLASAMCGIFCLRGPVLWLVSSYVATLFLLRAPARTAATGPLAPLVGAVARVNLNRRDAPVDPMQIASLGFPPENWSANSLENATMFTSSSVYFYTADRQRRGENPPGENIRFSANYTSERGGGVSARAHACVALGRCVAFGRPKMSVWGHAGARSAPAKVACISFTE
jgi:hypothetical protein